MMIHMYLHHILMDALHPGWYKNQTHQYKICAYSTIYCPTFCSAADL